MTALLVKVNVQSASKIGPTPIKVWRKPGMRCPLIVNPHGIWGKSKSHVSVDCWVCLGSVTTLTFGAERSMLSIGASVEN